MPFFLTQYRRIGRKSFSRGYALMLLMGIFCSFTHDAITIPLCLAFLMLAWQRRSEFFRLAIWPMVCGWVIGTVLQFTTRDHLPSLEPDIEQLTLQTTRTLALLWDTKIFIVATMLTLWFTTASWGRHALRHLLRRQRLISYSLFFALVMVPFAPLGIDNSVTSVCFFAVPCVHHFRLTAHSAADAPLRHSTPLRTCLPASQTMTMLSRAYIILIYVLGWLRHPCIKKHHAEKQKTLISIP